jgi:Flp pilus assembly pilin Flp
MAHGPRGEIGRLPRLRRGERGLSTVEFVVLLVLIACVALGAWRLFGASVKSAVLGSSGALGALETAQLDAANDSWGEVHGASGEARTGTSSSTDHGAANAQPGAAFSSTLATRDSTGAAIDAAQPASSPAAGVVSDALSGMARALLPGSAPSAPVTAPLAASAVRGVAAAARGPSLLLTGADIATDLLPYVSNVKDATTAITGVNPVTNERVGTVGRVLAGVFAVPAIGNAAKYLSKGAKYAFKGGKAAYEAAEAARAGTKIASAVGKTVEREVAAGALQRAEKELVERTEREAAARAEKEGAEAAAAAGAKKEPGTAIQTFWPPNRGFAGAPTPTTLAPGTRIDRYGSEFGTFVAPQGTPFGMRALPAEAASSPLRAYEVIKPIPAKSGAAAPWFGQVGGGIQHEFSQSIESLVKDGYLRRLP